MNAMLAVSERPCAVTITAVRDDKTLSIRLVGAVEMGAEAALNDAINRVRELAPGSVAIDLAGITFAGSLLANFLIGLHAAAPSASTHLHHATPMIRVILTATRVDELVVFDNAESAYLT
ncbi:STAS domain-containing protein [Micromonospora sp. BQ11]|uniref:STAS domain-containing protein n=1 Tax=Micromonospora sp. BQ11 TaxID=3452212 RepID=UPI003F8A9CBB